MTRFGLYLFAAVCMATSSLEGVETNATPDFKEVYDLIRKQLPGLTEAELNRAAVDGFFTQLRGKVTLVTSESAPVDTNGLALTKALVLEQTVAYLRVDRVGNGLDADITTAIQQLTATNKLKGVALDLRYAGGDDYAAAAAVADLFVADEKPLLDWGAGVVKSPKKFDIINMPVAVLVNRETTAAAEALAAVMRETGAGLVLGRTTAGSAMISQEFVLTTGQRLRIGTTPVKLGDGTSLSVKGVKPDIEVTVNAEDERAYFQDAYVRPARTNLVAGTSPAASGSLEGTNRSMRRMRTTEADLVRARRNGTSLDPDAPLVRDAEPEKPVIQDPALARAVDLLKGLAVVRRTQP